MAKVFDGTEAWTGVVLVYVSDSGEGAGYGQRVVVLEEREVVRTLGGGEVDDIAVRLEHVDLLYRLDGLDVHLLQSSLQLPVVGAGRLVGLLDLSPWGTLASVGSLCQPCLFNFDAFIHFEADRNPQCLCSAGSSVGWVRELSSQLLTRFGR